MKFTDSIDLDKHKLSEKPIGVFDSGVGGLTVLKALKAQLPEENFIYLGDTARLPYGTKSQETIIDYAKQALAILSRFDIKLLVIACNTASALALTALEKDYPNLPIIGVLESGATAICKQTQSGVVGLLATEATINSESYIKAIHRRQASVKVISQACPLFVALAEEGWGESVIAKQVADIYLKPLLAEKKLDAILLGCTHFPVLKTVLRSVSGASICILDSAAGTTLSVEDCLIVNELKNQSQAPGSVLFLVTDLPERFAKVAEIFLGETIPLQHIEPVREHL